MMDNKYHGVAIGMLPQVGDKYSAANDSVPEEFQAMILLVVGQALVNGRWAVLVNSDLSQLDPCGIWIEQDYFIKNFRKVA